MGKKLTQVKRYSDDKKWEDEVEWFSFPDEKMVLVRFIGEIEIRARHWILTLSGKMFPAWCPRMDTEEEWQHDRPCPAHADFEDRAQKMIISNVIVRQLQERGDPNPVKGVMLPHAVNDDLVAIAELIKCDPADEEKGVDLAIKFSSKAVGNKKWSIQRGDKTPLTEEEKRYRQYNFGAICPDFNDPEVATQYAKNMREAMARHKHYVVPTAAVPENARDPFKYFRGDARGKPWTDYAVLVDYKNAQKGDNAASYRVSGRGNNEQAETFYEEEETQRNTHRASAQTATSAARETTATTRDDPAEPARMESDIPRPALIQHEKFGEVPECFGDYYGTEVCTSCGVRVKCLDENTKDEM